MNACSEEETGMPIPKKAPVEKGRDLEAIVSGAQLTTVEVANLLRIHPTTVYKMAKSRQLRGFKIAGDWRFDPAQIGDWIRSRRRGPRG